MSNPGVILLASKTNIGPNIVRLDIEDNIGESIHIHINNFRFDFTIDQFISFSKAINKSQVNLQRFKGLDFHNFDSFFLYRLSPFMNDIDSISYKNIKLKDLKCAQKIKLPFFSFWVFKAIGDSHHYNFLINKSSKFSSYEQDNYIKVSNIQRINNVKNYLKKNKNYEPLVIYEGSNIIRDGLHRAAILQHLNDENYIVKCLVVKFRRNIKIKAFINNILNLFIKITNKLKNIIK